MIRNLVRAVVPLPIRNRIRAEWREYCFRSAVREFAQLAPDRAVPRALLDRLIRHWHNPYSAGAEYLDAVLSGLPRTTGAVLECGSGLTTILVGLRCQQLGRDLWALEHHPFWTRRVETALTQFDVSAAKVCRASLVPRPGYAWYDVSSVPDDLQFGMVVCDGPPSDTLGSRYGLLPVMGPRLAMDCVIFLDDAARAEEQLVLSKWKQHYAIHFRTLGNDPYAVVSYGNAEPNGQWELSAG